MCERGFCHTYMCKTHTITHTCARVTDTVEAVQDYFSVRTVVKSIQTVDVMDFHKICESLDKKEFWLRGSNWILARELNNFGLVSFALCESLLLSPL